MMKKPSNRSWQSEALLKDVRHEVARHIEQPARRAFLQRSLSLGGLSLLSGCAIVDEGGVDAALVKISRFNDKVQGWLFDPNRLAPTYPCLLYTSRCV